MASDARISTGLPSHPKTKKLIRKLGQAAGWNLVCLFLWAAANRSDGDLSGLSVEDIEIASEWDGAEGAFVAALVSVRFLDGEPGSHVLHDWAEHNPWAAGAEQRSAKARWNAVRRHHGYAEADRQVPEYAAIRETQHAGSSASSNADCSTQHADRVHDERSSNAPSPSPSPSPSPTKKHPSAPQGALAGFDAFWRAWPTGDRKQAKGKCLEAWKKAGAEPQAALVLAHVERMKASPLWTKEAGQFVPAPLVYLNQRRWEGAEDTDAQQRREREFV